MTVLEDFSAALRDVAARVGPAVVSVGRAGTGVVVGPGLVATNAHNLRAEETDVVFADGRRATARVAAADLDGDLAVLSTDTGDVPAIEWATDAPQVGSVVAALASPPGSGLRVTIGTVSAVGRPFRGPRGRRIAGSIEHTAPLARGSSGGPLVDGSGRVVGINTHRLGDGFYLALPAGDDLASRLEGLARGEAPARARLGVAVAPPHVAHRLRSAVGLEPRDGLLVRAVEQGGPADRAGIRPGDLIVSVGGTAVAGPDDLHAALDTAGPTGSVEVKVVRGSEDITLSVGLGPTATGAQGTA
ncbi:MAG TPA: trypsin-like peptidase domain-containing protein [Acidimicrobiales bacterium]|nr:trypsin-like peptidase domain-containing protein [Acidimicrobiales bacterium]